MGTAAPAPRPGERREAAFRRRRTCLAIYSRVVNAAAPLAEVLRDAFPWCASGRTSCKRLFAAYVAEKQAQRVLDYDDLLLCWAADDGRAGARARRSARASTTCWSTSTRTPTGCRRRSCSR